MRLGLFHVENSILNGKRRIFLIIKELCKEYILSNALILCVPQILLKKKRATLRKGIIIFLTFLRIRAGFPAKILDAHSSQYQEQALLIYHRNRENSCNTDNFYVYKNVPLIAFFIEINVLDLDIN